MSEAWTRERVMQVAPDPASAKAGEGLAHARKWASTGRDAVAAWGECQGSGAKPYQVQCDLAAASFKCSCPSRKFPCKHGIGLMLMVAGGDVAEAAQPAWVEQWLGARTDRQEKKAEKAAVGLSPQKQAEKSEAQEDRRAKRLDKVTAGMADLRVWLEDLIRTGLATAPTRGAKFFDERAKRLVDAQATGAARLVREIAAAASSGDGWQNRTLEAAALAHLLAEATAKLDTLPDQLQQDVLGTLGVPVPKELLDKQPAVADVWQVIGREVEVEENLKSQRTHLFGATTGRAAMLLDFAYGNAGLEAAVPVGTLYPAELAFYPGKSLRAVVRTPGDDAAPLAKMIGPESIAAALDGYATLLGERPWLGPVGLPLLNVRPVLDGGRWWLVDAAGDALPVVTRGRAAWMVLAVSAGRAVSVAATVDGRVARLLSVVADGAFTDLSVASEEAA